METQIEAFPSDESSVQSYRTVTIQQPQFASAVFTYPYSHMQNTQSSWVCLHLHCFS